MDITKFNQLVALADFAKEVRRCDFCAIDQEMTGVDVPGTAVPFGASPDEVYRAKRIAVEAYNAFQMGIALFTKAENGTYEVRPYNFYLLNSSGDIRLGLSAISFLAANNMNFQTWLTSGLAHCNEDEEAAFDAKATPAFADGTEQRIADEFVAAVDRWISTDAEPLVHEVACTTDLARRLKALVERRSDYRLSAFFEGKPYLAQKIVLTVKKLSTDDWVAEREKRLLHTEHERASVLGFRQFWKVLIESKKPIVGHNFMQDIMFMFHMHQRPLPIGYQEFKQQLQRLLPVIYDTKTMAAQLTGEQAFQVTHLGFVYQECRRRAGLSTDAFTRQFRLPPGFYSYNDYAVKTQSKAHEAAYDAYMTGVAFHLLQKMYGDQLGDTKNIISAFGSVYYMCVDTADRLTSPHTYTLETAVPCHSEDVEALLFATEENVLQVGDSGKVDMRKLSYQINGLQQHEGTKMYTSFCVRMKAPVTAGELHTRIQSLREKPLRPDANVSLGLLEHLTIHQIEQ